MTLLPPERPNGELAAFLLDPESGVLLDARRRTRSDGSAEYCENAVFRVPGQTGLRQQYISIAGLFRDTKRFDDCADALGAIAANLLKRRKNGLSFSALACSTATARHLMDHVHSRLRKPFAKSCNEKRDLRTEYHGVQLLQEGKSLPNYHGEQVLIVADVVASGSGCRELTRFVEDTGGNVAGILTVVAIIDDDHPAPRTGIALNNGAFVPLYSLCEIKLRFVPEDQAGPVEELGPAGILRRLIADPRNGMLLDAKEHERRNRQPGEQAAKNPVFELTSGAYQHQFVTAWGLFEKPWYFEYCMEHFAQLALEIRGTSSQWFSSIVTCTSTGRYIMEHLQARIETPGDPVRVQYLGPFPYHNLRHRSVDLKDQSVLVVTDIVVKGRMVQHILDFVGRMKGTPVGILALVGIVPSGDVSPNPTVNYKKGGKDRQQIDSEVPIYFLTSYCIPPVAGDIDKIYPIDPSTVLPVETPRANGFHPLIPPHEALEHFETSKALTVGFFGLGPRLMTAPIHIPRLLEAHGDDIWKRISGKFRSNSVLVSTFSRDDAVFHAFVEKRAASTWKSLESIFIPRSESVDFDFPYFAADSIRERLTNAKVVLLLSTTQTAETLRKLVALLAQNRLAQLTVICLLNRMGARTVNFISRIRTMFKQMSEEESFKFDFVYVYEIRDLNGAPLQRTIESIEWLVSQYEAATTEVTYQALTEQEVLRYFRPAALTGRGFESRKPIEGSGTLKLGGEDWNHQTLDGKVYAMFHYIAKRRESGFIRDYRPLIDQIAQEKHRPILYLIYAVLFSDISYLRLTNRFRELRETLMKCVIDSRREREELELADRAAGKDQATTASRIAAMVQVEMHHLFGLALFCYMDDEREPYASFIGSCLTCDREISREAWADYPLNLEHYCGNERILWSISFLAHFAGSDGLRGKLIEIGHSFRQIAKERSRDLNSRQPADAVQETSTAKMLYAWDGFLTHLGGHEALQKHQVIRYLQSVIIEPRPNHLLIINEPKKALGLLGNVIDEEEQRMREKIGDEEAKIPSAKPIFFYDDKKHDRLKRAIDDAIHASGSLEGVGDALAKLFSFHATSTSEAPRYLAGLKSRAGGLRKDVHELRRLLQVIRNRREVTNIQRNQLDSLMQDFESEFTLSDSAVLKALKWYIVPFQEKLRSAMEQADIYFRHRQLPVYWERQLSKLRGNDYVLCDPNLLKDVLWNLCTNIRHGWSEGAEPRGKVEWILEDSLELPAPGPDAGRVEAMRLVVESPLRGQEIEPSRTLPRQQVEISQFGGQLEASANNPKKRFTARITLLKRTKTYEAWMRRFHSFEGD